MVNPWDVGLHKPCALRLHHTWREDRESNWCMYEENVFSDDSRYIVLFDTTWKNVLHTLNSAAPSSLCVQGCDARRECVGPCSIGLQYKWIRVLCGLVETGGSGLAKDRHENWGISLLESEKRLGKDDRKIARNKIGLEFSYFRKSFSGDGK